MSQKYKFYNPEGVYFVNFAVKEWIDAELFFQSKHKAQVNTYSCEGFTWEVALKDWSFSNE